MADANINNRDPNLEGVENQLHETTLSNGETDDPPADEEVEERKITQTDHLNKRLLTAFFNRIKVQEPSPELPQAEPAENEDWEEAGEETEEGK
jgi:hypothetical protein